MLSKAEWIIMYGGQGLLNAEGFDVVPCDPISCTDTICHGWRVEKRSTIPYRPALAAISPSYRLLYGAARMVEDHMKTLNVKSSECSGCKRQHYENWADQQESRSLQAIIDKLMAYAVKENS